MVAHVLKPPDETAAEAGAVSIEAATAPMTFLGPRRARTR